MLYAKYLVNKAISCKAFPELHIVPEQVSLLIVLVQSADIYNRTHVNICIWKRL